MRILLANVDTTASMTHAMARPAEEVAATGTEIDPITPACGPACVEGNYESHLAAIAVMETVHAHESRFDAVIQAGYGEHGREGPQELLNVPVVDITQAAASTALFIGRCYSVVTTLDRTVPLIEDRLKLAGLDVRWASVRASGLSVLDLDRDADAAVGAIVEACVQAVQYDRAEVICLDCGGMANLRARVGKRTGVPVVDGVAAAVTHAEALVRLGLTTSKIRAYAPPHHKQFKHWPPTGIQF